MNIIEFRQRYPQYGSVPDDQLSQALYKRYYADKVDYPTFTSRFLGEPSPEPSPEPELGAPEPVIQPRISEQAVQPLSTPPVADEYPPPATLQQTWPPAAPQPIPEVPDVVAQQEWPKRVVPREARATVTPEPITGELIPAAPRASRTPADIVNLGKQARQGLVGSLRATGEKPQDRILEGVQPLPPVPGGEGLGLPPEPMRPVGPAVGPGIVAGAKRGAQVAGVQLGTMVPAGVQQYIGEDLAENMLGPGGPYREIIEGTTRLTPEEMLALPKPPGQALPTKQEILKARQAKIAARVEEEIAKIGPVAKGRAMAQKGRKRMMELAPPSDASTAEKWAQDFVAAGLGSFVPVLAVGAITRSPNLALGVMGMTVFPQSYVDYRERGRTHEQATVDALVVTAAETLTEKIPLEYILSPSGKRWLGRWLISAGLEGTQEAVSSLLTSAYDAGVVGDKMTFGEAIKAALWEGSIGAGMGLGGAAITQPFQPPPGAQPPPGTQPPGSETGPLRAEVYIGEEEPPTGAPPAPVSPPGPAIPPSGPAAGPPAAAPVMPEAVPEAPPAPVTAPPPALPTEPPAPPAPLRGETPEQAEAGRKAVTRQEKARETYQKRRIIDPERDDILTAIGKLGGISKAEAAAEFGYDRDGPELKNRGGLFPAWKRMGGDSFDGMAELLAERGEYLTSADPTRELAEKLSRALAGEAVMSEAGQAKRMEREAAEAEAWEREVAAEDDFTPEAYEFEGAEPLPEERTLADLGARALAAGVPGERVEAILERGAIQDLTDAEIATELREVAEEPRAGRPEIAQALETEEAAAAPVTAERATREVTDETLPTLIPPPIVYHGSPSQITKPTYGDDIGIHFGTKKAAQERLNITNNGKGVVKQFSINLKNPIQAKHDPGTWDIPGDALDSLPLTSEQRETALDRMYEKAPSNVDQLIALSDYLIDLGYDGITYGNAFEGDQSWIVFDADQIIEPTDRQALELTAPASPAQAPTKPAPTQQGLFAPPTTAEKVAAVGRQREAELRGEGLPEAEGPAPLFDEARRRQVDIADVAKQPPKPRKEGKRLDLLPLPEETVTGPDGETYTIQRTAQAALDEVDARIKALNKLMECLHG